MSGTMPTPKAGSIEVKRAFRKKIFQSLVESRLDQGDFLPEGKFSKLVTKDEVGLLLPGALPALVDFVCQHARKVFLINVNCCDLSDDLLSIMETCQKLSMTDDHLPIDNIARNGTCKAHSKEGCTHDKALDIFHDAPWDSNTVNCFFNEQWTFCSPVFKSDFQLKLKANCRLPFTWVSEYRKEGHFSTVFEAKLHADHHQDEWDLTEVRGRFGRIILYVLMTPHNRVVNETFTLLSKN